MKYGIYNSLVFLTCLGITACESNQDKLGTAVGIPVESKNLDWCADQGTEDILKEFSDLTDKKKSEVKEKLKARFFKIVIHSAEVTKKERGDVIAKRLRQKTCGGPDVTSQIPGYVIATKAFEEKNVIVEGDFNSRYEDRDGELHVYFTKSEDAKNYTYYDFVIPCGGILEPVDRNEYKRRYEAAETMAEAAKLADGLARKAGGEPKCQYVNSLDKFLGL